MLWRTHFLGGAVTWLLLVGHTEPKTAVLSTGIAGIAALLPDLDDPNSRVGRMVPVIPRLIKTTIGHRGALHSLLGAICFTFITSAVLQHWNTQAYVYYQFVSVITVGYVSHLIADSLTPRGVPWLWPVGKHFGLPIIQTGGFMERMVVFPSLLVLYGWLVCIRIVI